MLDCDQYLTPTSLEQALALMERFDGQHRLIAGATDLVPYAREARGGDMHFPVIIDLTRVQELRGISIEDKRIRMGALTTFGQCLTDPLLTVGSPLLGDCAAWVADDQIRVVATLGGNIVNASPAADGTVALMALNAEVTLTSRRDGARTLPLAEFVLGPGLTAIRAGEILTEITCDALTAEHGTAFEKVGRRRSLVIAVASAAGAVRLSADRSRFEEVRLALGAVAPVPLRLPESEAALVGNPVNPEVIRTAAELAADRVASRTRREYRRDVVIAFVERAVINSLQRLGVQLEVSSRG